MPPCNSGDGVTDRISERLGIIGGDVNRVRRCLAAAGVTDVLDMAAADGAQLLARVERMCPKDRNALHQCLAASGATVFSRPDGGPLARAVIAQHRVTGRSGTKLVVVESTNVSGQPQRRDVTIRHDQARGETASGYSVRIRDGLAASRLIDALIAAIRSGWLPTDGPPPLDEELDEWKAHAAEDPAVAENRRHVGALRASKPGRTPVNHGRAPTPRSQNAVDQPGPGRTNQHQRGGRGIRTHDELALIAVFKTAAIGH
jgi:hypothetical protein